MRHHRSRALRTPVTRTLLRILILAAFLACDDDETLYPDPRDRTAFKLDNLSALIERYRAEHGRWPTTIDQAYDIKWQSDTSSYWYDAWGSPVVYSPAGACATLRSGGLDRRSGTTDDIVLRFPDGGC